MLDMGKIMKKFTSIIPARGLVRMGPCMAKNGKNEMISDLCRILFVRLLMYSKYGKNNEKNSSLLFWPVGPLEWARAWPKIIKVK